MSITPYQISVPDAELESVKERLNHAVFPDELEHAGWDYGAPLRDVKRLAYYWRSGFDWKAQEARINKTLPQFTTKIHIDGFDELDIHFVHQRSPVLGAIPLLFVHGWPGSFLEVAKLLPLLHGSATAPAFSVVAPSLPNFGFSSAVRQKGFALDQYAAVCNALMLKVGYDQYVTQGGDWGMYITRTIGLLFPDSCKASHINMIRALAPTFTSHPLLALQHALTPYTARDRAGLARSNWFISEGSAYRTQQSTKPQTLGYALADSPVALLAWMYEKLHDWTDAYAWSDDEILTWVSVYWHSVAGPAASLRIYYEAVHGSGTSRDRAASAWVPGVKLGLARFPRELSVVPKVWGRTLGPVVYESEYESGGHFAAHERPDAVARDLNEMFGRKGGAYGVIKGRSGWPTVTSKL